MIVTEGKKIKSTGPVTRYVYEQGCDAVVLS